MGPAESNSGRRSAVLCIRKRNRRGWIVLISSSEFLQALRGKHSELERLIGDHWWIGACKIVSATTPTSTAPSSKTTKKGKKREFHRPSILQTPSRKHHLSRHQQTQALGKHHHSHLPPQHQNPAPARHLQNRRLSRQHQNQPPPPRRHPCTLAQNIHLRKKRREGQNVRSRRRSRSRRSTRRGVRATSWCRRRHSMLEGRMRENKDMERGVRFEENGGCIISMAWMLGL